MLGTQQGRARMAIPRKGLGSASRGSFENLTDLMLLCEDFLLGCG